MTVSHVAYELNNGFIMNWLTGGPQVIPLEGNEAAPGVSFKEQVAAHFYEAKNNISKMPVEPGPLSESAFTVGEFTGQWAYYRCGDDHLVDRSTTASAHCFARAWAYTQLVSKTDQTADFRLFTYGPVDVWINRKHILHHEGFSQQFAAVPFSARLAKGTNKLTVRFAGVGEPDCVLAFALKIQGEELQVQIPTNIPSLSRRQELEAVHQQLYLDRDVYAAENNAFLYWPEDLEKHSSSDARFQHISGRIYAQAEEVGKPGQKVFMGQPITLREGPYQAYVMPRAWEVYDRDIRVDLYLDAWVMGNNKFSTTPYATLEERKKEALYNATTREDNLFGEIARMAMGQWKKIEDKPFHQALDEIARKVPGSELKLLGLLGALARFGEQEEFPTWLKEPITAHAAGFRYTEDSTACDGLRFDIPDRLILFHTCEILAGQLYPEAIFADGNSGAQHRQQAEVKALAWMRARGQHGFVEWNSKENYAASLIALSYLVDLAETEEVWELGSVLMDKIFFSIAVNSSNGVYGVSQGRANISNVRSELLNELSGITRLMWGTGVFNIHVAGAVSFALLENYELPPLIADIAAGQFEEIWNLEQQDLGPHPVNLATYRTPGYVLSAAQDYRPGEVGSREHIWQAALGPQAVVFVNQPRNVSFSDVRLANFWRGNAVLPRVGQWKDTLIALYRLPDDDDTTDLSMDLTHAYFPSTEFDEYILRGKTAFGRKGSSYIALTAAQGLEIVKSGKTAFRELRSYGKQNIWICQMGRESTDGNFYQFQEKVLALDVQVNGLSISCQTLRGDRLQFSWSEPLTRNGEIIPLAGYKHFDTPFAATDLPCHQMEIKTNDYLLRLDFGDMV